ncbi:MAG: SRPBCC family protein [Aeromicrobium erythreum]
MDVERTFTVDQPIEEVFAFLSDFENTESWDPGTISTTRTSGDGGVGTTYRNRSRFMGREVDLEYETIAYEEPTHFVCRGVNGRTTATDHLTFTRDGDRTQIHYRAVFAFPKPWGGIAGLVLRRPIEKLADETVEQIRETFAARGSAA